MSVSMCGNWLRTGGRLFLLCVVGTFPSLGWGQEKRPGVPESQSKPGQTTETVCLWATGPIRVDGRADDAAWRHAVTVDRFAVPWAPAGQQMPKAATKTRLLWDWEYLYFLVEMEDAALTSTNRPVDPAGRGDDAVTLLIQPAANKPGFYEFHANIRWQLRDAFWPSETAQPKMVAHDKTASPIRIDAAVALRGSLDDSNDRDQGWAIEGRIPWLDLLATGGRPAPQELWRWALIRHDAGPADALERSTHAPFAGVESYRPHHVDGFASVRFVGPPEVNADLPYGVAKRIDLDTSRLLGSPDPLPPFRAKRHYDKLKLHFPIEVVRQPGSDRLWVIQQQQSYATTTIGRFRDTADVSEIETLLTDNSTAYDIKFHPKFAENGYVYIGSNGPGPTDAPAKRTRVTRYSVERTEPYRVDPKSAVEIISWPSDGHNGGALAFGSDGMLYVTSGDGTSDSDTNLKGQGLDHLLAKVLRIDVDHPTAEQLYSVPRDNPFIDRPGARPETWAYGLRNPWRMTADAETGHIWVGNNGQDLWEQAYLVRRGDNYGWSVMEGSHPFYPTRDAGPTPFVKPTVEHHHSEARSLTGGVVYYGRRFPELRGAYLYGDYSTGKIWGVKHDGQKIVWHRELADTTMAISGFGVDCDGELLICDHRGGGDGALYTLEPRPTDAPTVEFPRKLSDTGLFESVAGHRPHPALIPYSVNSPLWSDGAHKERLFVLPPGDTTIELTPTRGWNLPNGTVVVKSFALDDAPSGAANAPATTKRRWIETRLLVRTDNEWVGYSYRWNDAQTDAELVDGKGLDVEYAVRVPRSDQYPEGVRKQAWHYPSRAECMVCHSRAANYLLGLSTAQMNRTHRYGATEDHQLRVLEHLGLIKSNWQADATALAKERLKSNGLDERSINEQFATRPAQSDQRQAVSSSLLALSPEAYPRLADPYDPRQELDLRARSYLHANCAHCHVEAGGGNAQMLLEFGTTADKMKVLNVKPMHHTFDLKEARLVAPGEPERSVLWSRVSRRGSGQMPPLATTRPDEEAVTMLREWIARMKSGAE